MTKEQCLAAALGGRWTYDGVASWACDDGRRRVSRCSPGVDEFDNPLGPSEYWLYAKEEPPRRAEEFLFGYGKLCRAVAPRHIAAQVAPSPYGYPRTPWCNLPKGHAGPHARGEIRWEEEP